MSEYPNWNDPSMEAARKRYAMDKAAMSAWTRGAQPSEGGIPEIMRLTGTLNMTTGNIEVSVGTIDIPCEVVEPKRLEP